MIYKSLSRINSIPLKSKIIYTISHTVDSDEIGCEQRNYHYIENCTNLYNAIYFSVKEISLKGNLFEDLPDFTFANFSQVTEIDLRSNKLVRSKYSHSLYLLAISKE